MIIQAKICEPRRIAGNIGRRRFIGQRQGLRLAPMGWTLVPPGQSINLINLAGGITHHVTDRERSLIEEQNRPISAKRGTRAQVRVFTLPVKYLALHPYTAFVFQTMV